MKLHDIKKSIQSNFVPGPTSDHFLYLIHYIEQLEARIEKNADIFNAHCHAGNVHGESEYNLAGVVTGEPMDGSVVYGCDTPLRMITLALEAEQAELEKWRKEEEESMRRETEEASASIAEDVHGFGLQPNHEPAVPCTPWPIVKAKSRTRKK